jgi:hypothetical protein
MTKTEYEKSLILIQALLHCHPQRIEDILSMNPEVVTPDLLSVTDEVVGNLLQLGMVDRANFLRDFCQQISQVDNT